MEKEKCVYCEREFGYCPPNGGDALRKTVEHIYPIKRGGRNDRANLADSCHKCNSFKGHKTLSEFKAIILSWIEYGKPVIRGYYQAELQTIVKNIDKLHKKEHKYAQRLHKVTGGKYGYRSNRSQTSQVEQRVDAQGTNE